MSRALRAGSTGCLIALFCAVPVIAELPDSELNPVTGNIESVDAIFSNEFKVRHIVDPGKGSSVSSTTLSTHEGEAPRIAVDTTGDSWVVWWEDAATDKVYFRRHDLSAGNWTPQKSISELSEQSREPAIAHDGSAAWVAYQIDNPTTTGLAAIQIIDSPDPIPSRTIVATSLTVGDVDVQMHAESSAVWMTWVDDSDDVGWVEWDASANSWSAAFYESYAGSDVGTARDNIRDIVLGL